MRIFAGFVFLCLFPSCMQQLIECKSPDQEKILDAHNKLRNDFAMGKDPRAAGIKVANMMALEWDDDLEFVASCGVCPDRMLECFERNINESNTDGQNRVTAIQVSSIDNCPQKAYDKWYKEIKKITNVEELKGMGKSFTFQQKVSNFTQLVWAETTHVGCSLTGMEVVITFCRMTCNYKPAGNIEGARMFLYGEPCSACPKNVPCNKKYPGLCGKDVDVKDEGEAISVTIPVMFVSLLVQNYL